MTKMLTFLLACSAFSALAQEIATVVLVKGEALSGSMVLKKGDRVSTGTTVTTKDKSFVRIKFDDQVAIQAGANTEFKLSRNEKKDNTLLEIIQGEVLSRVQPKATFHERFTVKTPQATMGIRGTTLFTHVANDQHTFLCVCEGKVATRYGDKEELIKTTKHDRPIDIMGEIKPASAAVAHTEADIQALDLILGN